MKLQPPRPAARARPRRGPAPPTRGGHRLALRPRRLLAACLAGPLTLAWAGVVFAQSGEFDPWGLAAAESSPTGLDPVALPTEAELSDDGFNPDRLGPSLTIFYENDGSFIRPASNSDRHYTSGQGLTVAWHRDAADGLADSLGLEHDGTAAGLSLVQQMFTPRNIGIPDPPLTDRPYAGYLYLGGYLQRQYRNQFDHVELDIGIVGPSSGAEFNQEWIHDLLHQIDPDWSTQLGDELAVNLSYRHKWRIDLSERDEPYGVAGGNREYAWQLLPEVGVDVGTVYRRAHAGATLRFGFNLPDDFGPGRLIEPGSATGQPIRGLSTYGYVKAVGRYVEWNTFIEGSYSRNPSRAVSLQPWLGEFSAGFGVDWQYNNWVCNVTYGQTFRTREFETQGTDDAFGHVAIRLQYAF